MKIALIGATGYVGSYILDEALNRGHDVTAIVRHPEKLSFNQNLQAKKADIFNENELATLLASHDAVISSFNPGKSVKHGMQSIINAVKKSGVKRLLVVGGAGSLEVAPGVQLIDTPEFPSEWKETALATRESLHLLQKEKDLAWTFLSPSALLEPGERTGKFRLGKDQLIIDKKGVSKISTQDYALAMIDELENPKHSGMRFTVGY